MDEERRAIVRARLKKADTKLAAAEADLSAARYDDAASRAYYAMFHAARALLGARGLIARSHSGLAALFAEHFVRTGDLGIQFGRWLGQGRRAREIGDYDDFLELEAEETTQAVTRARQFLEEARRWLTANGWT
jgi:hypothetical protein